MQFVGEGYGPSRVARGGIGSVLDYDEGKDIAR